MKRTALVLLAVLTLTVTGCAGGAPESAPSGVEVAFIDKVAGVVDRPETDLLTGAHAACEQITGGRNIFQVHVYEDDTNDGGFYHDSVRVALAASSTICP